MKNRKSKSIELSSLIKQSVNRMKDKKEGKEKTGGPVDVIEKWYFVI